MEFGQGCLESLVMDSKFWKDKKVLLTGHTGFKGSWLSIWLQNLGVNLVGFSKSVPTQPSLFELANVKDGMTSIVGDISNFSHLQDIIKEHKPEIVIHMAAQSLVLQSYNDPMETYATNVMGTVNLLEAVRRTGSVRVIINVTSDKCYENKGLERAYHEGDPMGGYDPYSNSKGCAELITSAFRSSFFNPTTYTKHKIALASVRAGNVVGGGDWAMDRLIPDIMRGILEHTTIKIRKPYAIRSWQYILDPLSGYLLLSEKLWSDGSKYAEGWNFGPPDDDIKPVSWVIEKLGEYWGQRVSWESDGENYLHEADYLRLDCSKAKTKLGWFPKTNLELALQWTVEWYKQYEQKNDIRKFTEQQIRKFSLL